jgi:hypothetical protein
MIDPADFVIETLEDAKAFLREHWCEGAYCPCCKQAVKLYKRKLNKAMAICLFELFKRNTDEYLHIQDLQNNKRFRLHMNGGNFATMKYWGVIEQIEKDEDDTTRRTSGCWRITQKGRNFILSRITIPKYIFTYNMSLHSVSEEQTNIAESLTERFNYQELMDEWMRDPKSREFLNAIPRKQRSLFPDDD